MRLSPGKQALLESLVQWHETHDGRRPWRIRDPTVWPDLIADELVAMASDSYVYPLPSAIQLVRRLRSDTE